MTTKKGVFSWSNRGVKQIFRSRSRGIVAARKVPNKSDLLAVADSHVVILHDVSQGMRRSYRLKGSDVMVMSPEIESSAEMVRVMSDC